MMIRFCAGCRAVSACKFSAHIKMGRNHRRSRSQKAKLWYYKHDLNDLRGIGPLDINDLQKQLATGIINGNTWVANTINKISWHRLKKTPELWNVLTKNENNDKLQV